MRFMRRYAAPIITFFIFFPLFFTLSGQIFNPAEPLWHSGGSILLVPLPVSILAAAAGVVLFWAPRAWKPALWMILATLGLMLISLLYGYSREKVLLFLQVLLPLIGLVAGMAISPSWR